MTYNTWTMINNLLFQDINVFHKNSKKRWNIKDHFIWIYVQMENNIM